MMTFSECIAWGDRFLAWYHRATRKAGTDPKLRANFDRGWDRYTEKHGADWDQRAVNAIWTYAAASLGFRRQHRERLVVYLDTNVKVSTNHGDIYGIPRYQPGPWDRAFTAEPIPELAEAPRETDAQLAERRGFRPVYGDAA